MLSDPQMMNDDFEQNEEAQRRRERALVARINRRLCPYDAVLRKSRSARDKLDLGDFYVLNVPHNFVVRKDVDPEEFLQEFAN